MATVLGNNLTLYVGDGMRTIGCEDSCTLTIENQIINVTTKGSGIGVNRELGSTDWNIQASGVVFINPDFDGSGSNLDPFEFVSYSLQRKKVVCKFQQTDGTTTKWMIGNGLISTCSYVGQAGEHAMFNVVILADGLLYASTNAVSRTEYDGPEVYVYDATGSVLGFAIPNFNNTGTGTLYFVTVYYLTYSVTYLASEVENLTLSSTVPTGVIGLHAATGTLNFNPNLISGERVFVSFEPGNAP
jgi:hypothetical protein